MNGLPVNATYEPFSREPEYVEANRGWVAGLDLASRRRILDLACGTGTVGDLVFEVQSAACLAGLDISHESLLLARDHFAGRPAVPGLVEGSADRLPFRAASFDAVVMGNSIHNLPDLAGLLAEIRRVLIPGGLFSFNTSFYAGTFPPGTERFYREWLAHALAVIAARDKALRAQGLEGVRRRRGQAARAFSRPWQSPAAWAAKLSAEGFEVVSVHERQVIMTRRSFETVGAYTGLASVLLSGYPEQLASEALMSSVGPALEAVGMDTVNRLWLEVAVRRKE